MISFVLIGLAAAADALPGEAVFLFWAFFMPNPKYKRRWSA
jgi:hypothetical protein